MDNKSNKIIRFIRKSKIQTRLLWVFICVSLIPVLFIGIYAYDVYTDSINAKLSQSAEQTIKLLDTALRIELKGYLFYINSLSVSETVQNMLAEPPDGEFTLNPDAVRAIKKIVSDTTIQPAYLKNIRIADRYGNILYDFGYDDVNHEQYKEILNYIDKASPGDSLSYIKTFRSADMIVLGRKIYRFASSSEHIGYILVYINEQMLHDLIYTDITFGENSNILLINHDGNVMSSKTGDMLGTSIANRNVFAALLKSQEKGMSSYNAEFGGVQSLVVFKYDSVYDCFLLATMPEAYITNETKYINIKLGIVASIMIFMSIAATYAIYVSIMQPINKIILRRNVVADENLDREINDTCPDELGFLARTIDDLIADLKGMAEERHKDQQRKRELELEMLRYQINPHFLFNTLNTLRWVAAINEVPVLEEGITSLSSLLQSTLNQKNEFNTIGDEIANLKHYFSIQRIRYAECFEVEYQLDAHLSNSQIPRFILQPLAENAIIHGTDGGNQHIHIIVSCKQLNSGNIEIKIQDDGVGFNMQDKQLPNKERFSGIGLANVDERLRLYYNSSNGLQILTEKDVGTICRIIIPIQAELESE